MSISISRLVSWSAISLAATLALAACAPPGGTRECVNGTFCPSGTECSGDGTTCVTAGGCGNAVRSSTEECDDGNVHDGDGCSRLCNVERCGDGDVDASAGEVCDDGNAVDGDGCAADCRSDETCGNGVLDRASGEVCDDGNSSEGPPGVGDGCAADCRSTQVCGNRIVDPVIGERCDDGIPVGGPCGPDCRTGEGCGNGEVDPDSGEECDDGDADEQDDCVSFAIEGAYQCRIARCGDGIVAEHASPFRAEECDGGDPDHASPGPVETATCDLDCTLQVCGDGRLNRTAGEECDDGNSDDTDDCVIDGSYGCKISRCGDGVVATSASGLRKEQCDGGSPDHSSPGAVETPTCNLDCTTRVCGDGKINRAAGEQCDDGNPADGDGCERDCTLTPPPPPMP